MRMMRTVGCGGGVQVNYHTLSDFRKDHGWRSTSCSAPMWQRSLPPVVKLRQVAQGDGMRVRASAGAGSFRRGDKLGATWRRPAAGYAIKAEPEAAGQGRSGSSGNGCARPEREARVAEALARLPRTQKRSSAAKARPADQARASTTDAQATVMKMATAGFGPRTTRSVGQRRRFAGDRGRRGGHGGK